ncbi:hypothetical protein ACFL1R_10390 [Candidatus Latescibacterota bacterium]
MFKLVLCSVSLHADTVENVRYYRTDDETVAVYYDLLSSQSCNISMEVSLGDSTEISVVPHALSGDIGENVSSDAGKRIIWNLGENGKNIPDDLLIRVFTEITVPVVHDEGQRFISVYSF